MYRLPVSKKKIGVIAFALLFLQHHFSHSLYSSFNFIATFFIYSRQIIIMKKLTILFCAFAICATIISCRFPGENTSISYSEESHYYEMKAKFSESKTAEVDRWLDDKLAIGDMSFAKTEIDGDITLDDQSTFYIKKSPGYLFIKLDRDKNSDEVYYKIKSVCEGIKEVVK